MKNKIASFSLLALMFAAFAIAGPRLEARDDKPAEFAVIVNPQNSLTDIKLAMLRKLVLGERSIWGNGLSIELLLPEPGTPEKEALLGSVAEMSSSQFNQHWVAKVFRGEAATEPFTVSSPETAIAIVSTNPGAIAFIERTQVGKSVKVLTVDGIAPGEKGYPVR